MKTAAGQSSFAVLLFQDIAVIPMLAIFPLLAPASAHHAAGAEHAQHYPDHKSYINVARQRIAELEALIAADDAKSDLERDAGWDIDSLREEVRSGTFGSAA